MKIGQYLMKL